MRPEDDLTFWRGRLAGRRHPIATSTVRAPRRRALSSGAGAFLALAADKRQYWVKVPDNRQGTQVLVNEVIVGEVGRLLGAPVRERALLTVPPSITSWSEFPIAASPTPLLAHLRYTRRDDNAQRQAVMLGLWDLCVGEDPQWLYETSAAYSMWSYDHGLWFTTGEGDLDESVLHSLVAIDASMSEIPKGISVGALRETAVRTAALTPEQLRGAVSAVPVEWGTDDRNLEAMAWFLFRRREPVAQRLNDLATALSGSHTTASPK